MVKVSCTFDVGLQTGPPVYNSACQPGGCLPKWLGKTLDKLSELAEEALIQIEDKNYPGDLEDRGVSDIVRYGIAFSGKNVEVRIAR